MRSVVVWLAASCAVTTTVACSSSSSNTTPDAGEGNDGASSGSSDSSTEDTGSSGSSSGTGMQEAAAPVCSGSSDCMAGQICCVTAVDTTTLTPTTACQAAPPCPSVFGMNIQLCKGAADCASGSCVAAPMGMGMLCGPGSAPKPDSGTPEGGTGDGGGSDSGGGGDAASQDAATGG
jgi:hypothetical protein